MRTPKISNRDITIIVIIAFLFFSIISLVYIRDKMFSSFSEPAIVTNGPQTISETYSITQTTLDANLFIYQKEAGTDAATAAMYSLSDGSELWSWDYGRQWPMASLTKLMTAVIANRLISPNQLITITQADEDYVLSATATPTFKVGDTLTEKDLVTSMLTVSSDDAAEALADYYGRASFIQAMKDEAISLGMYDTTFVSPSGLSPENLSTTVDLYKLISFIWSKEPNLFTMTTETHFTVTVYEPDGLSASRLFANIDKLAGRSDFLGGKTGTLPVSAQNLIAIFNKNGPKAVIILGAKDRYTEADKILATLSL